MRIAVLIVAYNAEKTIQSVLARIPDEIWQRIENVVIFDDCSKDDTEGQSHGWTGPHRDKVIYFSNQVNLGYGGNQKRAYRYMIEQGYDIVVLLHGDGQYAPERLGEIIDPIERGDADAVFGSRMMTPGAARSGGMPFYKFVGNKILTGVQNMMLGHSLSEFHSGYRAYYVPTLAKLPLLENTNDFHFDTEIIIQLIEAQANIIETPIPTYYGDEICHVNGMRYAKDVFLTTCRYSLHKKGLLYDKRFDLLSGYKYTFKENRHSSHQQILRLAASGERRNEASPLRILDVGCGSGKLAAKLTERGCKVTGIDVYEDEGARAACERFYKADLEAGLAPVADRKYDKIIFADVLEHVREPETLLLEAAQLLDEDGEIIASTGNVGHILVRLLLLFGRFDYTERGILDRTHVKLFTNRSFKRLLRECSFEITGKHYCPIPFENIIPGQKWLSDGLTSFYMAFTRVWASLFAYQIILTARATAETPGLIARQRTIVQHYQPKNLAPLSAQAEIRTAAE